MQRCYTLLPPIRITNADGYIRCATKLVQICWYKNIRFTFLSKCAWRRIMYISNQFVYFCNGSIVTSHLSSTFDCFAWTLYPFESNTGPNQKYTKYGARIIVPTYSNPSVARNTKTRTQYWWTACPNLDTCHLKK